MPDVRAALEKAEHLPLSGGYCLAFTAGPGYLNRELNAVNLKNGTICFNAEWAVCLCLDGSEDAWNAFRCTAGHEEGHALDFENRFGIRTKAQFRRRWRSRADRRFILWVDEVHADFYSRKELGGSWDLLIRALSFKAGYRKRQGLFGDHPSFAHPSFTQRCRWAEEYDFSPALIEKIAQETGCTDRKLIQEVAKRMVPDA